MRKPVVLCVDDERNVLYALRQELEQALDGEYLIEIAESGAMALETYHELVEEGYNIQIIVCDQIMPGMKGDELLSEFYKLDPTIKSILLTGQAIADAVGNAINNANLFRYMAKPWDDNDLRMTIQEASRSYNGERELKEQVEALDKLNRTTQYLAETIQPDVLAERLIHMALLDTYTNVGVLWLKQPDGTHRFFTNQDDGDPSTADPVVEIRPAEAADRFPVGWMNLAFETGKPHVLDNAYALGPLRYDRRVQEHKIHSMCVIPIAEHDQEPFGILYLEEQKIAGHFTNRHLDYLKLLTSYTAVSFKNAWLYNNLEEEVKTRTATLRERSKAIEKDIQFARRIQNSILPPLEEMQRWFPQSFVLYQPKDVVSGDFYWLGHHKGYFFAVAADCTGHGVPGAFVSVLGSNLFTQAIYEEDLTDPADILNYVNSHLRHTLKQYDETSTVQDGMDVAMAAVTEDYRELKFSGAKRPLWLLRGGELMETKGDRFPIGGSAYDVGADDEIFTSTSIPLQPHDRFYLFSDGLTDQFGGEDGMRKFSTRMFREMLLGVQDQPMPEQHKAFRKGLAAWQGEQPQTDDRVLVGIQVPECT